MHLVLDNLNTHFKKCFDDVLGERAAAKLLRRVEFHHTPKHTSWLNMAEIEIGILSRQCLDRRVTSQQVLRVRSRRLAAGAQRPAANHRVEVHSAGCRPEAGASLRSETCVLTY